MSQISTERKVTYYIGICLIVVGIILFLSVFVFFFVDANSGMGSNVISAPTEMSFPKYFILAFVGIVLTIVGSMLMNAGSKGLAGSGILLDPDKAVEDLKPFNEAKGKMINDAVENISALNKFKGTNSVKEVIKIKCKSCGTLNDEDAKYCKSCAKIL
jgi:hypothetical protein